MMIIKGKKKLKAIREKYLFFHKWKLFLRKWRMKVLN